MIEEHIIQEPSWIKTLIEDVVVDAVLPLGFIGPLGYRYWEPGNVNNHFDGWIVAVFPTPNEVKGPCDTDGSRFVAGFHLDLGKIVDVFRPVEELAWRMPVSYNGDLDGPELSVQGQFAGKHVWLRFFHMPPPDEPSSYYVDPVAGRAWAKSA